MPIKREAKKVRSDLQNEIRLLNKLYDSFYQLLLGLEPFSKISRYWRFSTIDFWRCQIETVAIGLSKFTFSVINSKYGNSVEWRTRSHETSCALL